MIDKQPIDDETWLSILNGSQKADANSSEQRQVAKIRSVLLQQHEENSNPSSRKRKEIPPLKQEQQEVLHAKERERVLALLKQKKLLEPALIEKKTTVIDKIIQFVFRYKNTIIPVVLISFLAVTITPFLLNNHNQSDIKNSIDVKDIIEKGNPDKFIATKQVKSPHQYTLNFQQELITAGLKVNIKKVKEGWLLETNLPESYYKHQDIIDIMKKYSINEPMGGNFLGVLFIRK